MKSGLLKTFLILPGTALIFIPSILLFAARNSEYAHDLAAFDQFRLWIGLILLILGTTLAYWTVKLQIDIGKGTPAPWDPPRKLVIEGPYKYVRNPMISGALLILGAEALILGSWPIAWWMVIFFILNCIYFPLFEEKDLEKRFGKEYIEYKNNVPSWIPRLTPWNRNDPETL
jgi:protein-S-isoprenylcysteine O-methyltransferase Ste14